MLLKGHMKMFYTAVRLNFDFFDLEFSEVLAAAAARAGNGQVRTAEIVWIAYLVLSGSQGLAAGRHKLQIPRAPRCRQTHSNRIATVHAGGGDISVVECE